jgi:hypothetical protein
MEGSIQNLNRELVNHLRKFPEWLNDSLDSSGLRLSNCERERLNFNPTQPNFTMTTEKQRRLFKAAYTIQDTYGFQVRAGRGRVVGVRSI